MRTRPRRSLERHHGPGPLRDERRPTRLLLAAAAAVLVLAGCSGGDGAADSGTAPPSPLSTAGPAADAAATASPDPSASPTATATTVTSMTTFTVPSDNMTCYLAPVEGASTFVRCDLAEVDWSEEPPAAGCAGQWGGADGRGIVGMGGGEASVLCASDTFLVADASTVRLQYGSSITLAPITCTIERTGMDCENSETGHGFTVARAGFTPR